jgi:four helix bundle protein
MRVFGYRASLNSARLNGMMPFDRLEAGKAAYGLALAVYDATEGFPKREWYGLGSQARRAAFSIPLNLAEGSARRGSAEFRRFADIGVGSLSELRIALRLSRDRGLLAQPDWERLEKQSESTSKLLYRLVQGLERRAKTQRRTMRPPERGN